jgi:hypothetical protein
VVVLVDWVQPVSPLEQPCVLPVRSAMLQDNPAPQVPGQEVPQAVWALLKKPATLEADGQLPGEKYKVRRQEPAGDTTVAR